MDNRSLEVILLKKIKSLNNKFNIYPSVDLKHTRELKLPRVISKTITNRIIAKHTQKQGNNYKQIETHEHTIQFTFALDKELGIIDVENVRAFISHIQATRYWNDVDKLGIVIQKVGDLQDISQHTKDGFIERYTFDLVVTTLNTYDATVDYVEVVEIKQNGDLSRIGGNNGD